LSFLEAFGQRAVGRLLTKGGIRFHVGQISEAVIDGVGEGQERGGLGSVLQP
jgi:hypothetical protein